MGLFFTPSQADASCGSDCYGAAIWSGGVTGASTSVSYVHLSPNNAVVTNGLWVKQVSPRFPPYTDVCSFYPYCWVEAGYGVQRVSNAYACSGQPGYLYYSYYYAGGSDNSSPDSYYVPNSDNCYQRIGLQILTYNNSTNIYWYPAVGSQQQLTFNFSINANNIIIGQYLSSTSGVFTQNTSWISNRYYAPAPNPPYDFGCAIGCPQSNDGYVAQSSPPSANWNAGHPSAANNGGDFRANT